MSSKLLFISNIFAEQQRFPIWHLFLILRKRRVRNAKEPSFRASDAAHREIRNPEKPNQYDESWIPARALFTGLGRMTNGDAASVLRVRPSISASPFRPKMDINSIEKLMGL
jgi:hypothetical protein